jgi:hypothetical protein
MVQQVQTTKSPNIYDLQGDGIHVTYSTTSFDGKPHFHYQDAFQSKQFIGDQINVAENELGLLATVVTRLTVDSGSTSFTLVIPRVNLRFSNSASITTLGVTAVHEFSLVPSILSGQADFYSAHNLKGTAAAVVF